MWILRQEILKYSRLTFTFILVRKWRRSNKSDPVSLASRCCVPGGFSLGRLSLMMSVFVQRAFLLKRFYLNAFGVCLRTLHNKSLLSTSCRRLYPSLIGTRGCTRPKVITYLRIRFISYTNGFIFIRFIWCNRNLYRFSCVQKLRPSKGREDSALQGKQRFPSHSLL